jgi:hypothetical protein
MTLARRWQTLLALVILLFCAWRYYQNTVAIQVPGLIDTPSDFQPYYWAAQHITHGESPYLAEGYIYPPLLAFLVTPLTALDYVTARRVWFALSQLFLIAAAVLLWRSIGRDWPAACWIALVWALGGSAEEGLGLGQVGALLTLLLVCAIASRHRRQALSVGLAFALKLFPGILGIAVLLRRDRRTVSWMVAAGAAGVLLPWAVVAGFLKGPAGAATSNAWMGTPATLSWSLPSVVLRVLDPPRRPSALPHDWEAGTDLGHFQLPARSRMAALATSMVTLGMGLFVMLRAVRWRLTEEQLPWAMGALVALVLAASPVGWTHYQVLQYPGVALLLSAAWRQRQWLRLGVSLVPAGLLYPIPVAILTRYYFRYHAWTAYSPVTLYIWTSVTPLASLCLFAMFVKMAVHAALKTSTCAEAALAKPSRL